MVKDYGYDDRDRLTSLTYLDGMNTLASYNYTLDTVGNRTRVDELGGDYTTWGYDHQYRLTSETVHDGGNTLSSSYAYDAVGNRTSQTVNGTTTTYAYNALDQMTSAGSVTYGYDGRGNLTTVTDGSDVTTYTYDALDRLVTAQVPGSSSAAYTYAPNGQRVRQTVGSDTTNYLWDELSAYGDVVRETNGSGTELASYTLANGQLVAQNRGGVASYYLSDGQGSTRALLNGSGSITDTYEYAAFGELYNQSGTTTNPYLYTGQQFDSVTGLYDLRARYYDPSAGRFLSRDTYGINYRNPIELNRYGYTANNPINGYDPTGRSFTDWMAGAAATVSVWMGLGTIAAFTNSVSLYILGILGNVSDICGEESVLTRWANDLTKHPFELFKFFGESAAQGAIHGGEYGVIAAINPIIGAYLAARGLKKGAQELLETYEHTGDQNCAFGALAIAGTVTFFAGGGWETLKDAWSRFKTWTQGQWEGWTNNNSGSNNSSQDSSGGSNDTSSTQENAGGTTQENNSGSTETSEGQNSTTENEQGQEGNGLEENGQETTAGPLGVGANVQDLINYLGEDQYNAMVSRITNEFASRFGQLPEKVYIVGSYAKGEGTLGQSDIDIFVQTNLTGIQKWDGIGFEYVQAINPTASFNPGQTTWQGLDSLLKPNFIDPVGIGPSSGLDQGPRVQIWP